MSRSEPAMVDVRSPAPTEKSSQMHNRKPVEKMSDLLPSPESLQSRFPRFDISRRALFLSSTRKDPPSDTPPSTRTTSTSVESPEGAIFGPRSPVAAGCEGYNTAQANTHARPDVGNGGIEEISSDGTNAPQTPTSSMDATKTDTKTGSTACPSTSSTTGLSTSSSLGSTCLLFGEGQRDNGVSMVHHEISEELPDDHFRDAYPIPGCSPATFVYPRSSELIGSAFDERFREVINIFRHNTKKHPRLRENVQYIDYALKLCGTSPKVSHPSILVFCRHSEFEDLKGLLMSKELKYQYCLRRPSRKYPWNARQSSTIEEDHRPFFNLYFWRHRRPRALYWGQHESVRIHSQLHMPLQRLESHTYMLPRLTMCGSDVELLGSEPSVSTLGCVIEIDSEFYAITSMHAFRQFEPMKFLRSGEMSDCRLSVDSSSAGTPANEATELPFRDEEPLYGSDTTDPSDAIFEDGDYFIDDVEYESLAEDDEGGVDFMDSRSTVAKVSYGRQTGGQTRDAEEMIALFPTPRELDESGELDLDWALIKLDDAQNWRPNAFINPSVSSNPVFLSKVAESQPTRETPVFIITGETTPPRGMLQPGTSMLGGINGRTPSTMWTVIPCEQNSLGMGDSGSLVVDAASSTIYGHVVGSNPIGEVYISPYAAIFEQIQHRFPRLAVTIPEPISTLAGLISVFTTFSVLDKGALEFLGRLEEAYRKATGGSDGGNPTTNFQLGQEHYHGRSFPPVNVADQNPPCNTLYVSNLPTDASEEELRAMFSKQRGYKRFMFRTKPIGPMCFVQFEDVAFATKALYELYGHVLHNSANGGIRLTFSKNPLGVRSGQSPAQNNVGSMGEINIMASFMDDFTTADRVPASLNASLGPGLSNMSRDTNSKSNPYAKPINASGGRGFH